MKEAARVTREDGSRLPVTHPFYGMATSRGGLARPEPPARRRTPAPPQARHPGHRVQGDPWWRQEDLDEYVGWLREVFPGARFMVNTRDHEAVLASKFWRNKPRDGRLERNEESILEVADGLGDDAYHVHFDDYVRDPASLAGLFEWLGEPFDEAAVRDVMTVKHSY